MSDIFSINDVVVQQKSNDRKMTIVYIGKNPQGKPQATCEWLEDKNVRKVYLLQNLRLITRAPTLLRIG
jgi:hypothetical protein